MVELESHHFGTTYEITQTSKVHQRLLTTPWRVLGDRCEAQRQRTFTPRTCQSPRKSLTFRSGDPAVVLPPVTEPRVPDQCQACEVHKAPPTTLGLKPIVPPDPTSQLQIIPDTQAKVQQHHDI